MYISIIMCLIYEMLDFIKDINSNLLNIQTDSIRAKLFT